MKRLTIIAILCASIAGIAMAFDSTSAVHPELFPIRVSQDGLAECEATLRELRQKPVVTDSGWMLPSFMVDDDLPRTVCVVDA
jgi:hypothetical protein